jgi:hypothetical protein
MTSPEIFVEELAGVFESGPVAKVHLASLAPDGTNTERVIVCRLVGSVADLRQIASQMLDALKADGDDAPAKPPRPEPPSDEIVIGTVS